MQPQASDSCVSLTSFTASEFGFTEGDSSRTGKIFDSDNSSPSSNPQSSGTEDGSDGIIAERADRENAKAIGMFLEEGLSAIYDPDALEQEQNEEEADKKGQVSSIPRRP